MDGPNFKVVGKEMTGIFHRARTQGTKVAVVQGSVDQLKAAKKITSQQAYDFHQRLSKLKNSLIVKKFQDKLVPLFTASKYRETMDVINQLKTDLDEMEKEFWGIVKAMEAAETNTAPWHTPTGKTETKKAAVITGLLAKQTVESKEYIPRKNGKLYYKNK